MTASVISERAVSAPARSIPDLAIEIQGLHKLYRPRSASPVLALDHIDLDIRRGSMFGLLGPNGAGKSTTINILGGLVRKTGGLVRIWGHDIDTDTRAARASIGIVPQELLMDPFFTPRQTLELQAGLYGVPKSERATDEILAVVGLADKANAYARSLSGGMRRRLMVAKAMVHAPPILVLDEPTAGVDVELRQQLWAHVKLLNQRGTTILLTTHYLEEAQALCDRIAIIDRGRVVAHDTTEALLRRLDHKTLTIVTERDAETLPPALVALGFERPASHRLRLQYQPSVGGFDAILAAVQASGLGIVDLSTEEADLEDLFLRLTGHKAGTG